MAKKATGTKRAGARVETDQYFEGMEPPKIAELDRLLKSQVEAESALEAAKEELSIAGDRLQKGMEKHMDALEKDAKGNPRYLCKPAQMVATLTVKDPVKKVSIKKAPTAKAPSAG